jgi:hypothetical protein
MRCVLMTFPPIAGDTENKRGVFIRVGPNVPFGDQSFHIRVRESSHYGRWTTNGYDFHFELQNTSFEQFCVAIVFFGDTGLSYSGTWSGVFERMDLELPQFGASKGILRSGTTVNAATSGTFRLQACEGGLYYLPESVHVSTYAHNPATGKFLYFFPTPANNGAAGNSF